MKFKELLKKVNVSDVLEYFHDNYDDESCWDAEYIAFYDRLLKMEPQESELLLYIAKLVDYFDDQEYFDVSGYSKADDTSYAIEFTPWSEWLGMDVSEKSVEAYGDICFVAEAMKEMTFIGFSEDVIEQEVKELNRRAEEVQSGNAKLIPADEVFAELQEKYGFEFDEDEFNIDETRIEEINKKNKELVDSFTK